MLIVEARGVARVPCTLGQEIFLHPCEQKLQTLEVKNRCKSAEEAKAERFLQSFCLFLSDIKRILGWG